LDLRRLLAEAGIHAAEQKVAERLQRLLLEELHHRLKNTLATVMAITSQSLRTAESLEHGKQAIESRLLALGRVHDLLLQTNWTSHSSRSTSISLLTLPRRVLFSCSPAPHISDDGLATFIHVHMLDADGLRATVPQAT
jgi:two-component sensor histidine kinase